MTKPIIEKRCTICKKLKPIDTDFYKKTSASDGHDYYCIPCRNRRGKRYHRKNRKQMLEKQAEWRRTHRAELKKYFAQYWEENKERIGEERRIKYAERKRMEGK